MAKFRKNIINKEHTIGHLLNDNRDMLMASTTLGSLYQMVKKIFEDGEVCTPKSNLILMKLSNGSLKSCNDGLIYIQNIIFASQGLATY